MFGDFDRYIAVFLTALVVTYLITPLVRALACRFGLMDLPDERRPVDSMRLSVVASLGVVFRPRVSRT
jgi:UDP-N-acetylmuramyl pentapeptide phosphotransferase/UDP-N-acetylglucosamine-1-phosphate transferase